MTPKKEKKAINVSLRVKGWPKVQYAGSLIESMHNIGSNFKQLSSQSKTIQLCKLPANLKGRKVQECLVSERSRTFRYIIGLVWRAGLLFLDLDVIDALGFLYVAMRNQMTSFRCHCIFLKYLLQFLNNSRGPIEVVIIECVFEVFYYNWCLIGGSIKIELKRHPASKQQSQPYAMKQLGGGPKYAMTNISLPDAAGENLSPMSVHARAQKLAISCLKGLYLSWDTAEAAIFLMLMRNQITPGQANLEIE
nr:hypothetical protein CFP56_63909 [Quercus suber]